MNGMDRRTKLNDFIYACAEIDEVNQAVYPTSIGILHIYYNNCDTVELRMKIEALHKKHGFSFTVCLHKGEK